MVATICGVLLARKEKIMKRYLTGTVHYLTEERANEYKKEGAEIWKEDDGTWSVAKLSEKSPWPDQTEWVGRKKS